MDILIILASFVLVTIAQVGIKLSYSKYKKVKTKLGKTGKEIARQMLDDHGLSKVTVNETSGTLSDHYDPAKKAVYLSTSVYRDSSVASVAVAAHEVGHAIQDKEKYFFIRLRSKLVPVVNLASKLGYISIVIGLLTTFVNLITIGIIAQLVILLFHVVTLPVEFDASKRAKVYLKDKTSLSAKEQRGSATMLRAAAFTYVASVLTNLLQIFRLILIREGNK